MSFSSRGCKAARCSPPGRPARIRQPQFVLRHFLVLLRIHFDERQLAVFTLLIGVTVYQRQAASSRVTFFCHCSSLTSIRRSGDLPALVCRPLLPHDEAIRHESACSSGTPRVSGHRGLFSRSVQISFGLPLLEIERTPRPDRSIRSVILCHRLSPGCSRSRSLRLSLAICNEIAFCRLPGRSRATRRREVESEFLAINRCDDGAGIAGKVVARFVLHFAGFLVERDKGGAVGLHVAEVDRWPFSLPPTGRMSKSPSISGTLPAPEKY